MPVPVPSTIHPTPQRLLIMRPSALGDVCRSVPVLASLRAAFPGARIDWLVNDSFAGAIAAHPALSEAIPFPRTRFASWWRPTIARELRAWLRTLRARNYDVVLECQGLARSGIFAWATHAPRRIGYADARELAWLGVNERVHVPRTFHTVDRMLALVEALGVEPVRDMRLYVPAGDHDAVAAQAWSTTRYAVLAPTSRWPGKLWPPDRFAQVAGELLARRLVEHVLIVGTASERPQCTPILQPLSGNGRVVDLVGATGVGRLLAIIEKAALVIANDSAALHMAVGLDRPLIGLYGPTRVDLVGPYGRADSVIQHARPGDTMDHKNALAGRAMMERITVDEVLALATRLLAKVA